MRNKIDKNGKEINIGDIVEIKERYKNSFIAEVKEDYIIRHNSFGNNEVIIENQLYSEKFGLMFKNSEVEILGNKYDNPELLERICLRTPSERPTSIERLRDNAVVDKEFLCTDKNNIGFLNDFLQYYID